MALESAVFHRPRDGSVLVREAPGGKRAPVWPLSQVLAAAIDLEPIGGDPEKTRALLRGLSDYRSGDGYVPLPGHRRRYFDDNAWIGLCLAQLHLQRSDERYLRHARRVFGLVMQGRDSDGGVRWVEGRRARHTCAAAPAAQLALRLHLAGGAEEPLDFARGTLAWLDHALRKPNGLYGDHVDRRGVDETVWAYNQGTAAGALALLHRATGDAEPLEAALRTARASLRRLSGDRLWTHPPIFVAIWFRNLLALDAVEPVPGLNDALDGYLDRVEREGRDHRTGLFTAGRIGSYDGTPAIDHAGLVQLLALRSWPGEHLLDVC